LTPPAKPKGSPRYQVFDSRKRSAERITKGRPSSSSPTVTAPAVAEKPKA
jgi:hypothetical protein